MKKYPVEFVLVRNTKLLCVFFYPFNGDINVRKDGATLRVVMKSNDIGQGVMAEVILIELEQVRIGAKNIVDVLDLFAFQRNKLADQLFGVGPLGKRKSDISKMKTNGLALRIHGFKIREWRANEYSSFEAIILEMKLSQLRQGQRGRIAGFASSDLELKLMEMGCIPGEEVVVEQVAPLGDPISIRVAGYSLSLRLSEADQILLIPLDK